MNKLLIDLDTLPEEGKSLSGELDASIFGLSERDPKPLGPLNFDLRAQRFENELLLLGKISAPFEFECVRTLHPFTKTLSLPNTAISLEINGQNQIDATDSLREELLLEMPTFPTCDLADSPQSCEIDPRYLAVDNSPQDTLDTPPPTEGDSRWSALDSFQAPENPES